MLDRTLPPDSVVPAILNHHRLIKTWLLTSPALEAYPGGHVTGDLVGDLTADDIGRIIHFEHDEYNARSVEVRLSDGRNVACLMFETAWRWGSKSESWTLDEWRRRHKTRYLRLIAAWMAQYPGADALPGWAAWYESATVA